MRITAISTNKTNQNDTMNKNNNVSFASKLYNLKKFANEGNLPETHPLVVRIRELLKDGNGRRIVFERNPNSSGSMIDPLLYVVPSSISNVAKHILKQRRTAERLQRGTRADFPMNGANGALYYSGSYFNKDMSKYLATGSPQNTHGTMTTWLLNKLSPESLTELERKVMENL